MKENIIVNKSIRFSVAALNYCQILFRQKQVVIANQLSRAAVAIGANISEAQQAESRIDFIHKIKLAAKEASEVQYWLEICWRPDEKEFRNELMNDIREINAILSRIIVTSKKNTK
jgi:four helix bundle protein